MAATPKRIPKAGRWRLLALFCLFSTGGHLGPVQAQEPADTNYDEAKVPDYVLPPLLPDEAVALSDAERAALWVRERRSQVLSLFEQHVYGRTPEAPVQVRAEVLEASDDALGGTALRRQVRLTISPSPQAPALDASRLLEIEVLVYAPRKAVRSGRGSPAFIGLNFHGNQTVHPDPSIRMAQGWMRGNGAIGIVDNRATEATRGVYGERWQVEMLIERGYGLVTAYCGDIDPDNYRHDFSDGVHPLFYGKGQEQPAADEWGTIGAWAWGLSEIRRWLERQAGPVIDAKRLAVIGHSRLGKTALWAAARDQAFAMAVSNNSGCGGAALYRRCYGERIHHMLKPVGYWFCRNHAGFAHREAELPVDQHQLLALVAPRPLYVASAGEDRWADPKGEFLAARNASPVYQWLGTEGLPAGGMPAVDTPLVGRIGYHVRSGEHDVTRYDWQQYLDFADRHL